MSRVPRPLISCVVPAFNAARYLAEALESILSQDYEPLEVVVVDDGSTDDTAEVAARHGDRVICVSQPNAGLGAARNTGILRARGAFVAFLDADDEWLPGKLRRQMARFDTQPGLDLSVTGFRNVWAPEAAADAERYRHHPLAQPYAGYVVPTLLARRDAFERFGLFDPALRHSPGATWIVHALARGAVLDVIPDVLMHRRLHGANLSRTARTQSLEEFLHFIKGHLDLNRRPPCEP